MPSLVLLDICVCAALACGLALYRTFSVPRHLAHIPVVPVTSLLVRYLSGASNKVIVEDVIIPFAEQCSANVVLVWMLGVWMVHVVDPKLCHQIAMNQQSFPKVPASQDSLFLRFLGKENMVVLNGPQWKKQSLIIRNAFSTSVPIHLFAFVSRNAIEVIETAPADDKKGHTLCWSDLTQRIALDAIGLGVMGYDYDSVRTESPFMIEFSTMMHEFAEPLYLVFPVLERWLPRKKVIARVVNFEKRLNGLLEVKRAEPGEDVITKLATHPELSSTEVKDNMATLFFAGHDTSSSAMASVVYYLAVNKDAQNTARAEALRAFGCNSDPSLSSLGPQTLPYIHACIKEALRLNPPASFASPRLSATDLTIGTCPVPAGTIVMINLHAAHQISTVWDDPRAFKPERFMGNAEVYQQNVKEIDPCMPFLVGPRHCPARDFALYELRTVLVMLLREYEWSLPAGSIHSKEIQNALSPFNTSMPRRLDITFHARRT